MCEAKEAEDWQITLRMRNNLQYNNIPYVPMLLEDISIHLSFKDNKENGIKQIQTFGELISKNETFAMLLTLTQDNKSEFPVSFENLKVSDLYVTVSNDVYGPEKYTVLKVYGTLKAKEFGYVLEASRLVLIHNIEGTRNLMRRLVMIVRSEYRQYYRTQGQNNMLRIQWNKMKEDKQHLINESNAKKYILKRRRICPFLRVYNVQ